MYNNSEEDSTGKLIDKNRLSADELNALTEKQHLLVINNLTI